MKFIKSVPLIGLILLIQMVFSASTLKAQTKLSLGGSLGGNGGIMADPYSSGFFATGLELELEKMISQGNSFSILVKYINQNKSGIFGPEANSKAYYLSLAYNIASKPLKEIFFFQFGPILSIGKETLNWSDGKYYAGKDKASLFSIGGRGIIGVNLKYVTIKLALEIYHDMVLDAKRHVGDSITNNNLRNPKYSTEPYSRLRLSFGFPLN